MEQSFWNTTCMSSLACVQCSFKIFIYHLVFVAWFVQYEDHYVEAKEKDEWHFAANDCSHNCQMLQSQLEQFQISQLYPSDLSFPPPLKK
uniref:Uncharacterized protein n=1 Tax=Rhizophora mucronata TaxID=61149 RepID=A0A2P2PIE2_RHIMU